MVQEQAQRVKISIHAPREGSDAMTPGHFVQNGAFLSTLPARGATRIFKSSVRPFFISIHAPREGSDRGTALLYLHASHFYPRSPRGERPDVLCGLKASRRISIHAPREGSDTCFHLYSMNTPISIHAPREGSDLGRVSSALRRIISIHAPREGSDALATDTALMAPVFLSTLPARGATIWSSGYVYSQNSFLSTLPARGATSRLVSAVPPKANFYPRSPRGERRPCGLQNGRGGMISIHAPREGSDAR